MKFHCRRLSTLPFHRQFMWIFIITFVVSFVAWNVTIILQTYNAWKPSMSNVNEFVTHNNIFSLQSYSQLMGRTLYSHMDLDSSWMILVMNTILGVSPAVLIPEYQSALNDQVAVKDYSYAATYYSQPNNTIFSNKIDPHVDKILTAIFSPAITIFIKRFNVIYYNHEDMQDIMIKTVPADPDFKFVNPAEAVSRLNYAFQGYFFLTPSYQDVFSKDFSYKTQFAQRTKLVFENYTICLDFQVLSGGPSAKSMEFPIFQDVDQHMLYLNPMDITQMGVMTQSVPLRSDIDYFGLLENGYHQFFTSNGTLGYSFTLRMQMAHKIGNFHTPSNNVTDGSFVYFIVHSFGGSSFELQEYMEDFTNGAIDSIQEFILTWTFAFGLILFSLVVVIKRYIKGIQTNLRDSIHQFCESQLESKSFDKLKLEAKVYWAAHINLMRYTKRIFSIIRHKRKKYNLEHQVQSDVFPHNIFYRKFQEKYKLKDLQKLVKIKKMLKDIERQKERDLRKRGAQDYDRDKKSQKCQKNTKEKKQ